MKVVWWLALVLTVVGAVNWGLVGFFQFDLVQYVLGAYPLAATIVYDVVGVAGLVLLVSSFAKCKCCCGGNCDCK